MRILFATYSLAFQTPGGGEKVLRALRGELRGAGYEVDLFDPWLHDPASYSLIHYFSCLETSHWEMFRRAAPDAPLVVTPTLRLDSREHGPRGQLRRKLSRRLDPFSRYRPFAFPQLWLPSTDEEAEALVQGREVPRERVKVLPNGISRQFFDADPAPFRARFPEPFVLLVGRFHPVKNQLRLIRALGDQDLRCVFIGQADLGESDYYAACRSAATVASRARFDFLGSLGEDDPLLASAYAAASVLTVPSEFETFGLAALEGAAAGARSLVLTRNLGARRELESRGVTVRWIDPGDERQLRDEILAGLAAGVIPAPEPARKLRELGWDGIARTLVESYRQVQAGRPADHRKR